MPSLENPLRSVTAAGPVPGLVAAGHAVPCRSGAPGGARLARRLHEEEKRRADAADARGDRLKWEKVQAHSEAQYWKAQWGRARTRLEAARAEVEDLRDVSRDALHLRSEVERLETLLATIGVDTRKRSTIASLRIETSRLQAGNEAQRTQLQEVESDRDALRAQVETLSRAQFGRKSEQGRKGTGHRTGPGDKGEPGKRGPRPRRRDPRAHAAPRTGPQERGSQPAARGTALSVLRRPPPGQRIAQIGADRSRGQGPCAGHRPDPLAQDLPVS